MTQVLMEESNVGPLRGYVQVVRHPGRRWWQPGVCVVTAEWYEPDPASERVAADRVSALEVAEDAVRAFRDGVPPDLAETLALPRMT